jgi:enoyl-CoA hydratase
MQFHGNLAGMAEEVLVETRGPVTIVSIDRPAARNAVDGPTAAALADAYCAFAARSARGSAPG